MRVWFRDAVNHEVFPVIGVITNVPDVQVAFVIDSDVFPVDILCAHDRNFGDQFSVVINGKKVVGTSLVFMGPNTRCRRSGSSPVLMAPEPPR